MSRIENWMLPDGVEEILPAEARHIEDLRRRLLNLFTRWGFDLVIPPMMEFSDALMVGLGQDLEGLTYKVVDQVSGGTMAIRSDMTPQAARMDAHSLKREGVNRLCYSGHVLFTRAKSPLCSRSPLQVGVELFGESSLDADCEIISLLIESIQSAQLPQWSLDLGHVGIFRALAKACALTGEQERQLFELLQAKAMADIQAWVAESVRDVRQAEWLLALPRLSGSASVLEKAKHLFADAPSGVVTAIKELQQVAERLRNRYPEVPLYLDLSELRGYHYHTGIVFAAFAPGLGREIASGGRYDHIGEAFGRARPATGFTLDLIALKRLGASGDLAPSGIFVPFPLVGQAWDFIQSLRAAGERVVCATASFPDYLPHLACDRQLVNRAGTPSVQPIN
ncbi:MAG: ATP phosphoribosyltransferase regulatory subunit [Marinagarivorans sp.]